MARFYCPLPLAAGGEVDLPEAVAHHLFVVRMQPGDALTLFDGTGGEWRAELADVAKRRARARVLAHDPREAELPGRVTLAQGLPEGTKMDWIVEKAVELGVAALQPLALARSVVKLSAERSEKRVAHWRGIVAAACEQSGRNRLPEVAEPLALAAWLAARAAPAAAANSAAGRPAPASDPTASGMAPAAHATAGGTLPGAAAARGHADGSGTAPSSLGTLVLLSPRATESLAGWARRSGPCDVTLLIGPEGGLSAEEEDAAVRAGARALALGPRVLRTETAGLAALATLAAAWEA